MAGGVCVAEGDMHGIGVCMARGMHGKGGVHGRGHVWWGGMHGRGHALQILRDTVNERAVRILLECILVSNISAQCSRFYSKLQ